MQNDPNEPLAVTLTAQEWNALLSVLVDAPYRIVAPLIQKIGEQARAKQTPQPPMMPRANGEAHHASD
jgi:hypothetical protein